MEGYDIRRTITVKGVNIGVYFKDTDSPPLFVLSDLARVISQEIYVASKTLVEIAGVDHCTKLHTNMSYTIWTCDLEGLCNLVHGTVEEEDTAANVISTVKDFVDKQYRTLPGPLTVTQGIKNVFSQRYFSMVTVKGDISVRFVTVNNKRWFAVQDISKCFEKDMSSIEEQFVTVNNEHKHDITFKNGEKRLCIDEEGVKTLATAITPDTADNFTEELVNACDKEEQNNKKPKVEDLIVDGTVTDPSCFIVQKTKGNTVVALRYSRDNIFRLFNVTDIARSLGTNGEEAYQKAKKKNIVFVLNGDLFVNIEDLIDIFDDVKGGFTYCLDIYNSALQEGIDEKAYKNTNVNCEPVTMTREQLEKERITQPVTMKEFTPVKTTGAWFVVEYDNLILKENSRILTCFVKKKWDDPDEPIVPLFWSSAIGSYLNYSSFSRDVNRMCDEKEYCKVSLRDIKKFNIKMVTLEGVQTVIESLDYADNKDTIIADLKSAVDVYLQQHQSDINFKLEKYNTRRNASMEEDKVREEKQVEETVKETENKSTDTAAKFEESTISFMGKSLDIAVGFNDSNHATIYYNYKQLCDILGIDETKLKTVMKYQNSKGEEVLISIFDLNDAFSGLLDDVAETVSDLFKITKPTVVEIAERLGLKVKDNTDQKKEQDNIISSLLNSNDGRNYTLGAIVLAERFREILMILKIGNRELKGVPGPSNKELLEELWKYIDCQAPDQEVSFNFKKQVITVNERYTRLKNMIKNIA